MAKRQAPYNVGKRYAQDSLVESNFQDWMLQELSESGPHIDDSPTASNARRIARNMLQTWNYEMQRQWSSLDAMRVLAAAGARTDENAVRDFFRGAAAGFGSSLEWLADEVLLRLKEKRRPRVRMSNRAGSNGRRKVGDQVVLPSGLRVGMGRLRSPAAGTIDAIRTASDGSTIYGVEYSAMERGGKRRHTWIAESDLASSYDPSNIPPEAYGSPPGRYRR